jgi:hypothetical protein
MILEVVRDIIKTQKEEDGFLEQAKILIVSHDISFNNTCFILYA